MDPVYSMCDMSGDAYVLPRGLLQLPTFDYGACGLKGSTANPWYASIGISKAQIAAIGSLPEKIASHEEFNAIRERVGTVLGINAKWPPGGHLGSAPIEISRKHAVEGLSPARLESGSEYISASAFGSVIGIRLAELLQSNGVAVRWGKAVLRSKTRNYEYAVLEPEPRLLWTEAERRKWDLKVCEVCG
jgi:hypothetical protein